MLDPLSELTSAHRPTSQIREEADALAELQRSTGWSVVQRYLHREREVAIRALTSRITLSDRELDFYRASLRALDLLVEFPSRILDVLASEMKLASEHERLTEDDGPTTP